MINIALHYAIRSGNSAIVEELIMHVKNKVIIIIIILTN